MANCEVAQIYSGRALTFQDAGVVVGVRLAQYGPIRPGAIE